VYLCLDLGSTSFKAAVYDASLAVRGGASQRIHTHLRGDGGAELGPDGVAAAVRRIVADAVSSAGIRHDHLTALSVTSQAQTCTVLDPTGRPRIPWISWMDTRSARAADELAADPTLADFAEHCSFDRPMPGLQISLLRYIAGCGDGIIAPDDRVVQLPAWLSRRLCGRAWLDRNIAAMSGLYSLQSGTWWPAGLAAAGVTATQLPALCDIGTVVGVTTDAAKAFGVPPGVSLVAAGNDQTAGACGAAIHQHDAVLVNLGTAQVAYVCTEVLSPPSPGRVRGPYPGGRFYRMAVDNNGGCCVTRAANAIDGCHSEADVFRLAAAASPGAHGLVFRATGPAGAGEFEGLTAAHTAADRARAVVESMVERMRGMVEQLGGPPGQRSVLVAGGGSRAAVWIDLLADALGVPLRPAEADALLGAARMARAAVTPSSLD